MTITRTSVPTPLDFIEVQPGALHEGLMPRFEYIAELYPDKAAVTDHDRTITYAQLNAAANQLAHALLREIGPGEHPVALLLEHNISAVVAILAVLKAGRPYTALHPAHPVQHVTAILADAQPACLIGSRALQSWLEGLPADPKLRVLYLEDIEQAAEAPGNPGIRVAPDFPFSLYYTSGSTGAPKGVVIPHRFTIETFERQVEDFRFSPGDRIAMLSSISFSASHAVVLAALLTGATLCMYDFASRRGEKALEWLDAQKITVLRTTPAGLQAIFGAAPQDLRFPAIRLVTLSSDRARNSDVALFKAHTLESCVLVNTFASTEAGTLTRLVVNHSSVFPGELLPAGFPVVGKEILLLGEDGQPVAPGEPGEIVIRSRLLAAGYWRQPDLTAAKFVSDPSDPELKIFHSGDLGRWREDGGLEYLGRLDSQVKIRGHRVDLSAVEARLLEEPLVQEAVVIARPARHQAGQLQLLGFLVVRPGAILTSTALRQSLAQRLPEYAVPAFFIFLDRLPLNVHGKVDREALPEVPDRPELDPAQLPSDLIERRLVDIWSGVLKLERLGVHEDFFEMGGDSLTLLSMSIEVERAFSVSMPRSFFRRPTIHHLARLLREQAIQDTETREFRLEGHRLRPGERPRIRISVLHRLITQTRRSWHRARRKLNAPYFFEWLMARRLQRATFSQAERAVSRLSQAPLVPAVVYRSYRRLFRRLLTSLDVPAEQFERRFHRGLQTNLLAGLMEARRPFQHVRLRRNLEDTPLDQLDASFPVDGLEHLEQALRLGRGLILLSFHGTPAHGLVLRFLARRLGLPPIQTIAHNRAQRQSYLWGAVLRSATLPDEVTGSIYAEMALHGQRLLQRGEVVHIGGDIAKGPGRTHAVRVGDRRYVLKPGFAELALNTGAAIVPIRGRFLDDHRLLTELLPPLDPGDGSREQQLHTLVLQYAAFMDASFRSHPEALAWRKMKNHLRLPQDRGKLESDRAG